jgi:AcrR family transcriptional regulator
VTTRILDATLGLLLESGVEGMTINEVASRATVARATIYLRWPHAEDLVHDAIRRAMGQPVITASGDLEADLRRGADQARAIFSSATFLAVFPTLVRAILRDRRKAGALSYDLVAPGHGILAKEYAQLAEEAGLRTDIEGQVVMDLIVGAHINRLLATGRPPTKEFARQVAEVVLAGVRQAPS